MNVLLVEDHAIVRQGIKALLEEEADITVVGETGNGSEALLLVEQFRPHIVLMDLSLPGLGGVEAIHQIRDRFPGVRVVVLSMFDSEEYVFRALKAGASGYVVKQSSSTELVLALRAVAAGSTFLSPTVSEILIDGYINRPDASSQEDGRLALLTPREREVLQLVAKGFNSRQIAEQLHVSIKTVETHRTNMMQKLDVHDRAGLVKFAIACGLIAM